MTARRRLVLVGHGMVGHTLLTALDARGALRDLLVTVVAEEDVPAYDRIRLSRYFRETDPEDHLFRRPGPTGLLLGEPGLGDRAGIRVRLGDPAVAVDRRHRRVTTAAGHVVDYDHLVLATGSRPLVPPVPGADATGCFTYRTAADVRALRTHCETADTRVGTVIGGGLLGLEAAGALRSLGLTVQVVESAPWLMPRQLDEYGGQTLRRHIEDLDITVHTDTLLTAVETDASDRATGVRLQPRDGTPPVHLPAGVVVFAAGVRPRDDLARVCGLAVGEQGGIVVDETCRTEDERVYAVGDCALTPDGRAPGMLAPGNAMARVVADRLTGGSRTFTAWDTATRLKLLGVVVASLGDRLEEPTGATWTGPTGPSEVTGVTGPHVSYEAHGTYESYEAAHLDTRAGVYRSLRVSGDGRLLGGTFVGDSSGYAALRPLVGSGRPLPAPVEELVVPGPLPGRSAAVGALPDETVICHCHNVLAGTVRSAVRGGCADLAAVRDRTRAGSGCGSCTETVTALLSEERPAPAVGLGPTTPTVTGSPV
ncbi:FAD-dependent oxidoreductase [Streptomyces caniscabiei]|uniref:NAD(P)/FAD-dependent oxidoreductase n=1 Tax=Streptomyces caniscabiei TaxID=2746961 RepID=A0A927LCE1_9ACTN|nr:FAD-dependent oxidoreductase [Streptomyces caniscabiei]MBD9726428.1 NAD(P)/FAD-dependent oxidoreductase [Streptomyces caniscabiei]MDX3511716.1 FAD-dependent oxidoreductase [Streptomyces caniscabiei]MDX3719265.1 FAD-dependent oxidoreductase [Streptomyces caniscabiei]WEO29594.1 FAD-dependent oxidoreductase [Streptomyces caniscabiei]